MNRAEKQVLIDELRTEFGSSPHAVLLDFKGLERQRGHRVPQEGPSGGIALPGGEELPGRAGRQGHSSRRPGPEVRRHDRGRLHRDGPGGPGQGPRRFPEGAPRPVPQGRDRVGHGDARRRGCEGPLDHAEPARAPGPFARPLADPGFPAGSPLEHSRRASSRGCSRHTRTRKRASRDFSGFWTRRL